DDARLVVLNARDAAERGATILTRTACARIELRDRIWHAQLLGAHERRITCRAVVNATGPWVTRFLSEATPAKSERSVRLVKGSPIVVPPIFPQRFAYIFQNIDRRIVFAIPYEHEFTLIGTTDVDYHGEPGDVRIDDSEIRTSDR